MPVWVNMTAALSASPSMTSFYWVCCRASTHPRRYTIASLLRQDSLLHLFRRTMFVQAGSIVARQGGRWVRGIRGAS